MPILSGDVKLLKSANMADVAEGGGAPTGLQIVDGVSNSIFPDVSEVDRAGGAIQFRKVFAAVHSNDVDTYMGGNVIVADQPDDPGVSVSIAKASGFFEKRSAFLTRFNSSDAAGAVSCVKLASAAAAGTSTLTLDDVLVDVRPRATIATETSTPVYETQVDYANPTYEDISVLSSAEDEHLVESVTGTSGVTVIALPVPRGCGVVFESNADSYMEVAVYGWHASGMGTYWLDSKVIGYIDNGTVLDIPLQSVGGYFSWSVTGNTLTVNHRATGVSFIRVSYRTNRASGGATSALVKQSTQYDNPNDDPNPYSFAARLHATGLNTDTVVRAANTTTFSGTSFSGRLYPDGILLLTASTPLASDSVTCRKTTYPNTSVQVGTDVTTTYTRDYVPDAVHGITSTSIAVGGIKAFGANNSFAVVGHSDQLTATVTDAQTINCGRTNLSSVRVLGSNGSVINTGYAVDLAAGTVTFTDTYAYSQPVTIQHRIEDMALVVASDTNAKTVTLSKLLSRNYPAGSTFSGVLLAGNMFAQVQTVFDQSSWSGTWSDTISGSAATATFNSTLYPIAVTNQGAITERWLVRFTSATAFEILGENVGTIAVGNVNTDCAPINPTTNVPYFTIPALGWGSGWATGNVVRFNTVGAMFPVWVIRTVHPSTPTVQNDSFTLLVRGDVDA